MNVYELLSQISAGSVVSVIVLLLTLIEVTPIHVSPLAWIGKRVNKQLVEDLEKTDAKIEAVSTKLDDSIADMYRDRIFGFQEKLLAGKPITKEEFNKAIKACDDYETYIDEHNLKNGQARDAIEYTREQYHLYKVNKLFVDLPVVKKDDKEKDSKED